MTIDHSFGVRRASMYYIICISEKSQEQSQLHTNEIFNNKRRYMAQIVWEETEEKKTEACDNQRKWVETEKIV